MTYRHEIMRDLEDDVVLPNIASFSDHMRTMREYLQRAEKAYYDHEKRRWFLNAVAVYCGAVDGLRPDLDRLAVASQGMLAFRAYLTEYVASPEFTRLVTDTHTFIADLSAIRYSLLIRGNAVTVRPFAVEADYSAADLCSEEDRCSRPRRALMATGVRHRDAGRGSHDAYHSWHSRSNPPHHRPE